MKLKSGLGDKMDRACSTAPGVRVGCGQQESIIWKSVKLWNRCEPTKADFLGHTLWKRCSTVLTFATSQPTGWLKLTVFSFRHPDVTLSESETSYQQKWQWWQLCSAHTRVIKHPSSIRHWPEKPVHSITKFIRRWRCKVSVTPR